MLHLCRDQLRLGLLIVQPELSDVDGSAGVRSTDGADPLVVCGASVLTEASRLRDLLPIVAGATVLVECVTVLDGAEEARLPNRRRTVRHGRLRVLSLLLLLRRRVGLLWNGTNLYKSRIQHVRLLSHIITYLVKLAEIKEFIQRHRVLRLVEHDERVGLYC